MPKLYTRESDFGEKLMKLKYNENCVCRLTLPTWDLDELKRSQNTVRKVSVFINSSKLSAPINPEGLAVDYSSGNVYWVDRSYASKIHVTSSDAKHDVVIVSTDIKRPREISLHTPKGWVELHFTVALVKSVEGYFILD